MDPRPRYGAVAAKPWLHGKFDTFGSVHAVQARLRNVIPTTEDAMTLGVLPPSLKLRQATVALGEGGCVRRGKPW